MPLVDEYYEDRYRDDDTFWTNEDETSQVWVGMYSLLCRKLGIDEDAEAIATRVYDEFGDPGRWHAYDDVHPALRPARALGVCVSASSRTGTAALGSHGRPWHRARSWTRSSPRPR